MHTLPLLLYPHCFLLAAFVCRLCNRKMSPAKINVCAHSLLCASATHSYAAILVFAAFRFANREITKSC
jgi:hypothetical protein